MMKPIRQFLCICAALHAVVVDAGQASQADVASSAASSAASEPMTLKERLSDKASDEQRADNCKVPVDKRGAKVRPDSCAH
jgi:hypothetical protein